MNKIDRRKQLKWIIPVIAIAVICIIAIVIGIGNSPSRRAAKLFDLGQQYLSDGEYEQAIAAFEEALTIDPKNVDAYLGEAEAYVALGDYENAIAVLERGLAVIDDERLARRLAEVHEMRDAALAEATAVEEVDASVEEEAERTLADFADLYDFTNEEYPYSYTFMTYEELRNAYAPWIAEMEELILFLHDKGVAAEKILGDGWRVLDVRDGQGDGSLLSCVYATLSQCYLRIGDAQKCMQVRQEWADAVGMPELTEIHTTTVEGPNGVTHTYSCDGLGRQLEFSDFSGGAHDVYTYADDGYDPVSRVRDNLFFPSGTETSEFSHDGEGRIIRLQSRSVDSAGAWGLSIYEYSYQGNVVSVTYTFSDNIGNGWTQTYQFHLNEYGSPTDSIYPPHE